MPSPLAVSAAYRTYARGIRDLHRLALAGQEDSAQADAIRDATDSPWEELSDVERFRAQGLSEDLYSISDPPTKPPQGKDPQAISAVRAALAAFKHGEFDKALETLRECKDWFPPALLSQLRGLIWRAAGDEETAAIFFEHAAQIGAGNGIHIVPMLNDRPPTDSIDDEQIIQEIMARSLLRSAARS